MLDRAYSLSLREAFPIHELEPLALILYVALTVAFWLYYLWRYLKRGVITFDTYFIVLKLYVPVVFIFPFNFSEINSIVATGHFHEIYKPYLHDAFYITVFGIAFFTLGAIFASVSRLDLIGLPLLVKSFRHFWITRLGIALGVGVVVLLLLMMLSLDFEIGNARATAMANPGVRPLYNLFHVLVSFIALNALIYGYKRASWPYLLVGAGIALMGLFGGTRAASVGTFLTVTVIIMISTRYKNLLLPAATLVLALGAAIYIGGFRQGVYDLSQLRATPALLLYGNNFSDLRDFAWIMSGWDNILLQGKTQLAGFLSFIPSSLFEYRATWSWGRFSTVTAGLGEVTSHPGFRPPLFGEFFFNYGLLGVAISGFLTGFVIFKLTGYMDVAIRRYGAREGSVYVLSAMTYSTLFLAFMITAGFFVFHIALFMILLGEIIISAVKSHRLRLAQQS